MSDDEVTLEMVMPLDSDGFLRRECPTCEREFKWLPSPEDGTGAPVMDGGYFCPYCGIQAEPNSWLTHVQVELAQSMLAKHVLGPALKKSGFTYKPPPPTDPLTEVDDMTRVDFECHPSEPVKVSEDWTRPVRCLICGQPVASAS